MKTIIFNKLILINILALLIGLSSCKKETIKPELHSYQISREITFEGFSNIQRDFIYLKEVTKTDALYYIQINQGKKFDQNNNFYIVTLEIVSEYN